ncbi:hypothetical protein CR513_27595, partial [Mucuna pruriens]
MAASFDSFTLLHVPKDQNERADLLAKLASTRRRGLQRSVIHENLSSLTIDKSEVQHNESRETWMDPIIQYLKNGKLLEDSAEQYLYRRGFSYPLLRCVDNDEALYVIQEVHEGICGTHIRGRALAGKIARAGYYWPTLKTDCMDYVKKCDKCQRFTDVHQVPLEQLHVVASPWPFHKWGIDILGPFPMAPGQVKFPMATITVERDLHIKQSFTSVEHPQTNGQAEAANRVILRGLRRRLEEAKGRWAEELPQVLWSYDTTSH